MNQVRIVSRGNAPHNSVIHSKKSHFDTKTGTAFMRYAEEKGYNIAKYLDVNGNYYYEMVQNPLHREIRSPLTYGDDSKRNPLNYIYNSDNFAYYNSIRG